MSGVSAGGVSKGGALTGGVSTGGASAGNGCGLDVVEAGIDDLRAALDGGIRCVDLVAAYLARLGAYDRSGIRLNSVPVIDPGVFAAAAAADERRRTGRTLGPLDGIPFTVKDSFAVAGLPVAAGSPAFARLVAREDAHVVASLRAAGAVLVGLTTMPPMANGGMQRGLHGRAESPYDARYLPAAFASGSSNGSGVATAASFAAFGIGAETWSSGRSPASCNALVCSTPSRGVLSVRGQWPLVPTMDVVAPHTRTVRDLLLVLDAIAVDDPRTDGDFWRSQPWVAIQPASEQRPVSGYAALDAEGALRGRRIGVPRRFVGDDSDAAVPIETRDSVLALWIRAARDLADLGAELVEVDVPAFADSPADPTLVPPGYAERELLDLSATAWDDYLRAIGDPHLPDLASVDAEMIAPPPRGALPDSYPDDDAKLADYVAFARVGVPRVVDIPELADGVLALEATRRRDLEDWMAEHALDALAFPALADVARADADTDPESSRLAWRPGVGVANGGTAVRHLGIPTVTVPMGTMPDTRMPVGLTLAGPAGSDALLLALAADYEAASRREPPPRTPSLVEPLVEPRLRPAPLDSRNACSPGPAVSVTVRDDVDALRIRVDARTCCTGVRLTATVDGAHVRIDDDGAADLPPTTPRPPISDWCGPYPPLVVVVAEADCGAASGALGPLDPPLLLG